MTKPKIRRLRMFAFGAIILAAAVFLCGVFFLIPRMFPARYSANDLKILNAAAETAEIVPLVSHINTPASVHALYMTACVAASPIIRAKLVDVAKKTDVNSFVIDIKDYSGTVSIPSDDKTIQTDAKSGCRYPDIKDFIAELHRDGIYVIGRITVFQDPYYSKLHPELAVRRISDGGIWKDYKGLSYIDVSAKPYWDYIIKIGKRAVALGFDELNFDYLRFPSDGNMKDISYPLSDKMEKKEALRLFFIYLQNAFLGTETKLSADLFGMTTSNTDDLNIGQYLEYTLPYFDYVSPMVYPSHFPPTWNGYKNPADNPYGVVHDSMAKAYERASTTPQKLRPWLQDFSLGTVYTADMVKEEIKAVYDAGLNSWMMWNASNKYTVEALNSK